MGDAIVGVVANPLSGRDIRRVVTQATVFPTAEKASMIGRLLTGFGAAGVHRALLSVDLGGISAAVFRALGRRRPGDPPWPEVEFLDGMPITQTAADTTAAVERMVGGGAQVIVCLGGDGTARVAAAAVGEVPMLPVSTGTNNAFPAIRETTVAGLAAGLVATGAVPRTEALTRAKVLLVEAGDRTETALVDVAVSTERHVATRAIWDPGTLTRVFCAFAEPDAIGLSSVFGQLAPVSRTDPFGVTAALSVPDPAWTVVAPIAPGLVTTVNVGTVARLEPGVPYPVLAEEAPCAATREAADEAAKNATEGAARDTAAGAARGVPDRGGCLAVDGERELTFGPGTRPSVTLRTDGPWCVDVPAALAASARRGALTVARPADDRRAGQRSTRRSPWLT